MIPEFASLEIGLSADRHGIVAESRFAGDEQGTDYIIARNAPVPVNLPALRSLCLDRQTYGRELTSILFHDQRMMRAWSHATHYAAACDVPLHVRLRLDDDTPALHGIRWELLHDPIRHAPLSTTGTTTLSFAPEQVLRMPRIPERSQLRGVVVHSNPSDLEQFQLAPLTPLMGFHCATALSPLPTVLLDGAAGRSASLDSIITALWRGVGVLVLLAHATQINGETYVWLSNDDGTHQPISGETFVAAISGLPRPPAMIVLASCWSAGIGDLEGDHRSLGAMLARAGVGSVVAQVGAAPMQAVSTLLPRFLASVMQENNTLTAMSSMRAGAAASGIDHAMRLWCSARSGRVWRPARTGLLPETTREWTA